MERLVECTPPSKQSRNEAQRNWVADQMPLFRYAYRSWYLHAREALHYHAEAHARPVASILRFLQSCKAFPVWELRNGGRYDYFTSPIHFIAYYHLPSLLSLIDPLVNEQTKKGKSALSLAALQNDVAMVGLLLKLDGIDVDLQDEDGNTALMHAAGIDVWTGRHSPDVVKALVADPRISINKRNRRGETALYIALRGSGPRCTEAALHLIAAPGIDINEATPYPGLTLLMVAYRQPIKILDRFLQHPDFDPLKRDNDGWTPLMYACLYGDSSSIHWYLQLPGVDARDVRGNSALTLRAQNRTAKSPSDFRALVDAGLDVNDKNDNGFTALACAVMEESEANIQALLQLEGADANAEDMKGRTLLMLACDIFLAKRTPKAREILALLLQHPSLNVNAKNKQGVTALAYAVASGALQTAPEISGALTPPTYLLVTDKDEGRIPLDNRLDSREARAVSPAGHGASRY
jgi:ankyrin repeat protein